MRILLLIILTYNSLHARCKDPASFSFEDYKSIFSDCQKNQSDTKKEFCTCFKSQNTLIQLVGPSKKDINRQSKNQKGYQEDLRKELVDQLEKKLYLLVDDISAIEYSKHSPEYSILGASCSITNFRALSNCKSAKSPISLNKKINSKYFDKVASNLKKTFKNNISNSKSKDSCFNEFQYRQIQRESNSIKANQELSNVINVVTKQIKDTEWEKLSRMDDKKFSFFLESKGISSDRIKNHLYSLSPFTRNITTITPSSFRQLMIKIRSSKTNKFSFNDFENFYSKTYAENISKQCKSQYDQAKKILCSDNKVNLSNNYDLFDFLEKSNLQSSIQEYDIINNYCQLENSTEYSELLTALIDSNSTTLKESKNNTSVSKSSIEDVRIHYSDRVKNLNTLCRLNKGQYSFSVEDLQASIKKHDCIDANNKWQYRNSSCYQLHGISNLYSSDRLTQQHKVSEMSSLFYNADEVNSKETSTLNNIVQKDQRKYAKKSAKSNNTLFNTLPSGSARSSDSEQFPIDPNQEMNNSNQIVSNSSGQSGTYIQNSTNTPSSSYELNNNSNSQVGVSPASNRAQVSQKEIDNISSAKDLENFISDRFGIDPKESSVKNGPSNELKELTEKISKLEENNKKLLNQVNEKEKKQSAANNETSSFSNKSTQKSASARTPASIPSSNLPVDNSTRSTSDIIKQDPVGADSPIPRTDFSTGLISVTKDNKKKAIPHLKIFSNISADGLNEEEKKQFVEFFDRKHEKEEDFMLTKVMNDKSGKPQEVSLFFSYDKNKKGYIVTSPQTNNQKQFTAVELALAHKAKAELGNAILDIDANYKFPTTSKGEIIPRVFTYSSFMQSLN